MANASPLVGEWVESKTDNLSGKLKVHRNGAVSMSVQQGQYSSSVAHSLSTGTEDSSLKLGVGSELGKFSGSVSRSPNTEDNSYGIGWGLTW